jgi:hypothetical protein
MSLFRPLEHYREDFPKQLMATIVWGQVFAVYCLILVLTVKPTQNQIFWADPFLKVIPIDLSVWVVIISSFTVGLYCLVKLGSLEALFANTPGMQILSGVSAAMVIGLAIFAIVGDSLPDFVPAEESAKPGYLYGMAAGYGEEVLMRFTILPIVFFGIMRLTSHRSPRFQGVSGAIMAITLGALAFLILHEIGETDHMIVWKLVLTRLMVPCLLMGTLTFLVGPGFVVFMHATMHIVIPILFT